MKTTKTPEYNKHIPDGVPVECITVETALPVTTGEANRLWIESPYGWRKIKIDGKIKNQYHDGIDINTMMAPGLSPMGLVFAIEPGRIIERLKPDEFNQFIDFHYDLNTKYQAAWTPYIVLAADSGRRWVYRHVNPLTRIGEEVKAGQTIAEGKQKYGFCETPHLHLECYESGIRLDPVEVLKSFGYTIRIKQ